MKHLKFIGIAIKYLVVTRSASWRVKNRYNVSMLVTNTWSKWHIKYKLIDADTIKIHNFLVVVEGGGPAGDEKNGPNGIWGFVKMRGQKDLRTAQKGVNKIES